MNLYCLFCKIYIRTPESIYIEYCDRYKQAAHGRAASAEEDQDTREDDNQAGTIHHVRIQQGQYGRTESHYQVIVIF